MEYNPKTLAERLKQARKEAGYSLEKVAELCSVQQYQTVSKWENGRAMPSLEKLLVLCNIYRCELGYLLGEYDCKTRTTTDIQRKTGLSERTINMLAPLCEGKSMRMFSSEQKKWQKAIDAIFKIERYNILELIYDYLFMDDKPIELKDGGTLPEALKDAGYLLEVATALKELRKGFGGGVDNGQH